MMQNKVSCMSSTWTRSRVNRLDNKRRDWSVDKSRSIELRDDYPAFIHDASVMFWIGALSSWIAWKEGPDSTGKFLDDIARRAAI